MDVFLRASRRSHFNKIKLVKGDNKLTSHLVNEKLLVYKKIGKPEIFSFITEFNKWSNNLKNGKTSKV